MKFLLTLLFPRKCILCQRLLPREEAHLCSRCARKHQSRDKTTKKFRFIKKWYALWQYEDDVRQSIHRFKFHDRQNYAASYGYLLAQSIQDKWEPDIIAWVPLSVRRKSKRGYDQGQCLGKCLSREMALPLVRAVDKIVDNPSQSGISGEAQRRANVAGVYALHKGVDLSGKRVLLVDDVVTTGATASECARVLLTGGAREVYLATVAAVPRMK